MSVSQEEFTELTRAHYQGVYRFLFRFARTVPDAENLTQETFLKAWRHLKKFDPEKNFKTWIYTIAKNTALDFLKKKKEPLPFSILDTDEEFSFTESIVDSAPLPPELFERAELAQFLVDALNTLSFNDRTVLTLYHHEELTFREIAEVLGEPLDTVKSRYRRALHKLRARLVPPVHQ